jgi:hypothetical protein
MVETAAHLAEHIIPRLPVRQWVLSVPKRLRYHLQRDPAGPERRAACLSERGRGKSARVQPGRQR